jgi:hypothetical protein
MQKKLGSEALEKVYYIFYRQGGRDSKQVALVALIIEM